MDSLFRFNKHYWLMILFIFAWATYQLDQYRIQSGDTYVGAMRPTRAASADRFNTQCVSPLHESVLRSMDFLTPYEGWAFVGQCLYWTTDGGASWREISPRQDEEAIIHTPFFLDTANGWAVITLNNQLVLAQTTDGGHSWSYMPLDGIKVTVYLASSAAYPHFINNNVGWIVFKYATSINFSVGELYFTTDGGHTWAKRAVPLGEPVTFLNENIGWIAGGPMQNQLFKTEDGGVSWQTRQVVGQPASNSRFIYLPPVFRNEEEGFIPVLFLGERRTEVTIYVTADGGTTWASTDREVVQQAFRPQNMITLTTMNWLMTNHVQSLRSRDGLHFVDFVNPHVGWTYHTEPICEAGQCSDGDHLMQTIDGGQSWFTLTMPGFEN